jgi:hypothetical protein
MKSWDLATNLLLDKVSPNCGKSMRQVLMSVKSSKFPSCRAFHTIDGTWREEDNVTFTFVPENEDICRKLITGLIPFLCSIDPWFLSQFTESARNRHRSLHWNAEENEVYSTEELEMANNVYGDDELNCSDEPTAVWVDQPTVESVLPEVEITGDTPAVCQDVDSVLTFRSKRAFSRQTSISPSTPLTSVTTPSMPPRTYTNDDGTFVLGNDGYPSILATVSIVLTLQSTKCNMVVQPSLAVPKQHIELYPKG